MDIRTFRQSHGLTLKALGKEIGVTKGYLSQVENGEPCSQAVALKLEKFSEGAIDASQICAAVMAARGTEAA
jgi:transcriptional regulator with XRE-family HTH domain